MLRGTWPLIPLIHHVYLFKVDWKRKISGKNRHLKIHDLRSIILYCEEIETSNPSRMQHTVWFHLIRLQRSLSISSPDEQAFCNERVTFYQKRLVCNQSTMNNYKWSEIRITTLHWVRHRVTISSCLPEYWVNGLWRTLKRYRHQTDWTRDRNTSSECPAK